MFAGCASTKDEAPKTQTSSHNPKDLNPEVGMTKEEVISRYGKTDRINSSSDGEVWVYLLNMGEAFIPFNFGYHPKVLSIVFEQ